MMGILCEHHGALRISGTFLFVLLFHPHFCLDILRLPAVGAPAQKLEYKLSRKYHHKWPNQKRLLGCGYSSRVGSLVGKHCYISLRFHLACAAEHKTESIPPLTETWHNLKVRQTGDRIEDLKWLKDK